MSEFFTPAGRALKFPFDHNGLETGTPHAGERLAERKRAVAQERGGRGEDGDSDTAAGDGSDHDSGNRRCPSGATIQSSIGGAPNVAGVVRENFDRLLLGTSSPQTSLATGLTVILTPDAAITVGSAPGLYAAPFLSGGNGIGFGPGGTDQANGLDQTQYLTSGSTGAFANAAIDLVLPGSGGPYSYFGLLWGSVDLYNTLTFYDAADNVIGTVTGGQINPAATGDQGLNGTFYVNITSDTPFTRVRVTSSQYAFELDNVAWAAENPFNVPAPTALGVFGMGLLGLAWALRHRRRG